jgi:hypothetical protein
MHVFAMDSEAFAYSPESQASQIEWLRNGLRNSTATWKFVTMHSPPYSSSLHNSNPLYQLPFQQWGAHAVFSGHDHVYERVIATNAGETSMPYFVNGLGGSNIYPFTADRAPGSEFRFNQDFGAMRVTVSVDQAVFEFFSIDSFSGEEPVQGTLIDSLILNRDALSTPPVLGADFNGDGFVNEADLSTWRSAVGLNADGDANGDAHSNGADFLLWQQQRSPFQSDHPPTLEVVPQPASAVCLFCAAAIAAIGGRRRFSTYRR